MPVRFSAVIVRCLKWYVHVYSESHEFNLFKLAKSSNVIVISLRQKVSLVTGCVACAFWVELFKLLVITFMSE